MLLKLRDTVAHAVSNEGLQRHIGLLQKTTERRIEGNPVKAVEVLSNKLTLSETEGSGIMRRLIEGGDLSQYGLVNAVTRASQDVDSYDRATELERLGSDVLYMPKGQWDRVATIA